MTPRTPAHRSVDTRVERPLSERKPGCGGEESCQRRMERVSIRELSLYFRLGKLCSVPFIDRGSGRRWFDSCRALDRASFVHLTTLLENEASLVERKQQNQLATTDL